jgi:hypothetical protein
LPAENTLTVAPGFIGAYPNAIYRLQREEIRVAGQSHWRTCPRQATTVLWQTASAFAAAIHGSGSTATSLQDAHLQLAPITAGLLDYNRLENR